MEVVYAHCPAAEHFGLLPESFYQPVIQSAVDIDGEQSDELADRWAQQREIRAEQPVGTSVLQPSCAAQARQSSD